MAIISKRKNRERRESARVSFDVVAGDVTNTIDFMGIADGFTVTDVNVTVDEAFENSDNTIAVGIEGDYNRFITATAVDSVKGIAFNNRHLTASQSMAIVIDVAGTASATGKATVSVSYSKLASSKQEY